MPIVTFLRKVSDLGESDVDPDDDDSLSFESVIKSGGDERDFWYDWKESKTAYQHKVSFGEKQLPPGV